MAAPPDIAALIPQTGRMCLLDRVVHWNATGIECRARSHLDPANPLRRQGRLGAVCGIEYGMQAAAAHGGLCEEDPAKSNLVLASARAVRVLVDRLDDPGLGELVVRARLALADGNGRIYEFAVDSESGQALVSGRAAVMRPS